MNELVATPKLDLILKTDKELRLYFMIGRNIKDEKVVAIIGYELESVLQTAQQQNLGYNIIYKGQNVLIKDLLGRIKVGEDIVGESVIEAKQETSKESFVNGLKLVADRFVEGSNDKRSLKRILDKIK